MSAGNACAAIGLANTSKIPAIGGYVQDTGLPLGSGGPSADGPYIGANGSSSANNGLNGGGYWSYNAIGELVVPDFLVPANSGAAAGKLAHWVWTDAAPMVVAADGLCDVALGVVTALATTGTFKTYITPGTIVPAGSYLWVFGV
jgi:hypothetical protein